MSDLGTWGAQPPTPKNSSEQEPFSVAKLGAGIKDHVAKLGAVWVEGELAKVSLNPDRGNMFAQLKDLTVDAAVDIHAWNLANVDNTIKQGDRVVALVKLEFWPKSGKLSASVIQLRKVGLGDLLERIERLRSTLKAEGLTEIKQPLPFLPNKIGLITGANSDAEKDVLQNAKLRWPEVQFRVINTLVQGDGCAPQVIAAIKELDADPEVDVIIIARGGGSFMDLLPFSDEALVRAAAATSKPLVSAIGHEADRPVLDDVADLRASTPTDAAKRVVPDVVHEREVLEASLLRITGALSGRINSELNMLSQVRSRPVLANPYGYVTNLEERLALFVSAGRNAFANVLNQSFMQIDHLKQQVKSLSPQGTLDRGYAVIRDESGHVLSDASKVKTGTKLKLRLAKGDLGATAD
jgi:exodeoxyribonuclease VII large subunit